MIRTTLLAAFRTFALVALAACEHGAVAPTPHVSNIAQISTSHELGRQVYNFRCYYCHGYSGDAQTLAATFLNPAPRNFKTSSPAELPREHAIDAITNGRTGTAMKGFARVLAKNEILAVADFILDEFTRAKGQNTHYHTDANGWRNHERYRIAFPFATGEIALDELNESLSLAQRQGKRLFMNACISCHDRGRARIDGPAWAIRPVTYPPDFYLLAESGRADEHSGFDPHHTHEKPRAIPGLTKVEKHGERLYQKNCAFCHAADGTGRNWIGSFLEPNASDFSASQSSANDKAKLTAVIAAGIEGTSMPAWKNVLTAADIAAVAAYVVRAFAIADDVPQRTASVKKL